MDPDAALAELRRLLRRGAEGDAVADVLPRIVELIEALDGWITRGGFLPAVWRDGAEVDAVRVAGIVDRALRPCGLAVARDSGGAWAVVSVDDAGAPGGAVAFGVAWGPGVKSYARNLRAGELARWADGWLACWRVWGGGKG